MKSAVLIERQRSWPYTRKYVAKENPLQSTEDVTKAFVFSSIKQARDVKRGLRLRCSWAARAIPSWLS